MPVPKNKQKKYGIIVAAQTNRLKKQGMSGHAANEAAKALADSAIKIKKEVLK